MTREEIIKELEEDKALYMPKEWIEIIDRDTPDGRLITALDMAIKALEQEDVLNKIKTEIIDTLYIDSLIFGELIDFKNGRINADDVIEEFNRVAKLEVLKIFEKYKAESEVENADSD